MEEHTIFAKFGKLVEQKRLYGEANYKGNEMITLIRESKKIFLVGNKWRIKKMMKQYQNISIRNKKIVRIGYDRRIGNDR